MSPNTKTPQVKKNSATGQPLTPQNIKALQKADALLQAGLFSPCIALCEKLVRQSHASPHALHMLGMAQLALGEYETAENNFRRVIELYPDFDHAHFNLAGLLQNRQRFGEALQEYQKTLMCTPGYHDAYDKVGSMLATAQNHAKALPYFVQAIMLAPERDDYWIHYFDALRPLHFRGIDAHILPVLCRRLAHMSQIDSVLTSIAIGFLSSEEPRRRLFLLLQQPTELETALRQKETRETLMSELSLMLLERKLITFSPLEQLFTQTRKCLLSWTLHGGVSEQLQAQWQPFLYALSHQCFRSEYVYYIDEEEQRRISMLREKIEALRDADMSATPLRWEILLYSCYAFLHRLSNAEHLLKMAAQTGVNAYTALLDKQIGEPLADARAAQDIRSFGGISDAVSQSVQEQYEENPYPRWDWMGKIAPASPADELHRILPAQPAKLFAGVARRPNILIAGCGTGRQALLAACRFKNSTVLAIDLSRASLAYASRKLREAGCTNVTFLQADILSLGTLGQDFDIIESIGVLHHMHDPVAGWKVLVDLLRPQGVMKIGLYSKTARTPVVQARAFIAREGYAATPEGIRLCRRAIMQNADVPEKQQLLRSPDFYTLSECRDLLFHVQEHQFTLPQIARILEELQCEFLGFEHFMQHDYERYRQMFPQDEKQTSLQNWQAYEQQYPLAFAGMYQFWIRK